MSWRLIHPLVFAYSRLILRPFHPSFAVLNSLASDSLLPSIFLGQIKDIPLVLVHLGEVATVVARVGHLGILPDLIHLGEVANVVARVGHLLQTRSSDEAAEH